MTIYLNAWCSDEGGHVTGSATILEEVNTDIVVVMTCCVWTSSYEGSSDEDV